MTKQRELSFVSSGSTTGYFIFVRSLLHVCRKLYHPVIFTRGQPVNGGDRHAKPVVAEAQK